MANVAPQRGQPIGARSFPYGCLLYISSLPACDVWILRHQWRWRNSSGDRWRLRAKLVMEILGKELDLERVSIVMSQWRFSLKEVSLRRCVTNL